MKTARNDGANASKTDSKLLSLPVELRNKIWEFALCDRSIDLGKNNRTPPLSSLARVCRQTLVETTGIFFREIKLNMIIRNGDGAWEFTFRNYMQALEKFICKVTGIDDYKVALYNVSLDLHGSPNWSNTLAWAKEAFESTNASQLIVDDESSDDFKINAVVLNTAIALEEQGMKWEDVEPILEGIHQVAATKNRKWK